MDRLIPNKAGEDEDTDPFETTSEMARDAQIAADKPPHHG
jgi:hypothetical protein